MTPVITIVGPTASGKSDLAQIVAQRLNGEVVSADSMQIYKGMDIGTAKVPAEKMLVPHHLIDVVDPGTAFSAQLYQRCARKAFDEIAERGNVAVLCGGTGLYVQAALEDMNFPKGEQTNNPFRESYEQLASSQGNEAVWNILNEKDPESAAVLHPNNVRRVIRALEMHEEGVSYAQQVKNLKCLDEVVPSLRFGLAVTPETLRKRIDMRVDTMIEQDLVSEVTTLLSKGLETALTAPQAIGYKEIVWALKGEITLDEAIDKIKVATRRYAKRQRSWFRRDGRIEWLDGEALSTEECAELIVSRFRETCA